MWQKVQVNYVCELQQLALVQFCAEVT